MKKYLILLSILILSGCAMTSSNPIGPSVAIIPSGNSLDLRNYNLIKTHVHYSFTGAGEINGFVIDDYISTPAFNGAPGGNGVINNLTGSAMEFGWTNMQNSPDGWFYGFAANVPYNAPYSNYYNVQEMKPSDIIVINIVAKSYEDSKYTKAKMSIQFRGIHKITNAALATMDREQSIGYETVNAIPTHWTNLVIPFSEFATAAYYEGTELTSYETHMEGSIQDWAPKFIMTRIKKVILSFVSDQIPLNSSSRLIIDDFKIEAYRPKK